MSKGSQLLHGQGTTPPGRLPALSNSALTQPPNPQLVPPGFGKLPPLAYDSSASTLGSKSVMSRSSHSWRRSCKQKRIQWTKLQQKLFYLPSPEGGVSPEKPSLAVRKQRTEQAVNYFLRSSQTAGGDGIDDDESQDSDLGSNALEDIEEEAGSTSKSPSEQQRKPSQDEVASPLKMRKGRAYSSEAIFSIVRSHRFSKVQKMLQEQQAQIEARSEAQRQKKKKKMAAHIKTKLQRLVDRSKELRERQQLQKLPAHERLSIATSFNRFDFDSSGALDPSEILNCLYELGLAGSNVKEKQAVRMTVREVCEQIWIEQLEQGGGGEALRVKLALHGIQAAPADFSAFALRVIPEVRHSLLLLRSNAFVRDVSRIDQKGTGVLTLEQCRDLVQLMGIDVYIFEKVVEERREFRADEIEYKTMEACLHRCRELTERAIRDREFQIRQETRLPLEDFIDSRSLILQVYESFQSYATQEGGVLTIPGKSVYSVLRENGFHPDIGGAQEIIANFFFERLGDFHDDLFGEEADAETDVELLMQNATLELSDTLVLIKAFREFEMTMRRDELLTRFTALDKDQSGALDVSELCEILEEMNCVPRNLTEQAQMATLMCEIDKDASGNIGFQEFEMLVQHVSERMAHLRYNQVLARAVSAGFTAHQMSEFHALFTRIDADHSGKLDAEEVRSCLTMLGRKPSPQQFRQMFDQVDEDGSGHIDLLEFVDLLKLSFDQEGDTAGLPPQAMYLPVVTMRALLGELLLDSNYLLSLKHPDLVQLFCASFGIDDTDSLRKELGVSDFADLKELAEQMGNELRQGLFKKRMAAARDR